MDPTALTGGADTMEPGIELTEDSTGKKLMID
jgi:hypothetical protein